MHLDFALLSGIRVSIILIVESPETAMASSSSTHGPSSAVRALALELKSLQDDPLEGIRSKLVNDENMFEWEVALFGPPETLYEGGYFKVSANADVKRRLEIMTSTQESELG